LEAAETGGKEPENKRRKNRYITEKKKRAWRKKEITIEDVKDPRRRTKRGHERGGVEERAGEKRKTQKKTVARGRKRIGQARRKKKDFKFKIGDAVNNGQKHRQAARPSSRPCFKKGSYKNVHREGQGRRRVG